MEYEPLAGTVRNAPVEWYQFTAPDNPELAWRVHVTFLLSNWTCIYGRGCAGIFGSGSATYQPDIACCYIGAHINSREEMARLDAIVAQLTEDDLGPKGLAYIRRHGWRKVFDDSVKEDDPDYVNVKTKVRDGGCVMAKRTGDGDEKTGCAFVHYGNRTNQPDHISVMPDTCWRVPLMLSWEREPFTGREVRVIHPVDGDVWGDEDIPEDRHAWMHWWCTDTPDAYVGNTLVYRTMELELRRMMGDQSFELMAKYLDGRKPESVPKMAGTLVNDGRPLLPVVIGDRTPKRSCRS